MILQSYGFEVDVLLNWHVSNAEQVKKSCAEKKISKLGLVLT